MARLSVTQVDRDRAQGICTFLGLGLQKEDRFYELCFAMCSPQTKVKGNQVLNKALRYLNFHRKPIRMPTLIAFCTLVRFKERKAHFLTTLQYQWNHTDLDENITRLMVEDPSGRKARRFLVKKIQGIGMKTASQYLRNAYGCTDLAVFDTHVLKYMGDIDDFSTPDRYEELEKRFRTMARKRNLTIAELDAIIFVKHSGISWEDYR